MKVNDLSKVTTKYRTILADPPWRYNNINTGGSLVSGSHNKYPTLSLEEICNLPIEKITDKDCILFLWATTPLLPDCLKVLSSWCFAYKTAIYWRKIMSLGMGFWFRGQVELVLVGIKGNVKPFRLQRPNFIQTRVGEHSSKPEEFYNLIEECVLEPKIELFARVHRKGWDVYGYDAPEKERVMLDW